MKKQFFLTIYSILFATIAFTQNPTIDGVVAIIGSNIVLQSDIESQYLQYVSQGFKEDPNLKCKILEELMFQKLLVQQAAIDSVKISESQVDDELDKRIRYFIKQLGSKEKLEEYYKKSLFQIKSEFRTVIKDLLMAQTMESKITKDLKVSPSEIKLFYKTIPIDSMPKVNSEIEIGQILKQTLINKEEKKNVRKRMEEFRERLVKGESFAVLATLYSEDQTTAKSGGEVGIQARGELIPEIEAVAFNLKPNEVSPVIETESGFYIIQLIERKGDNINYRQLLLKPKVSETDLYNSKLKLDSIATIIKSGNITFWKAVSLFSDDLQSKNNKGLILNPQTGTSKFETDELDPTVFFIIDKMKVGDISEPTLFTQEDGKKAYRILYLKTRTEPHRANLTNDYDKIQTAALNKKKNDLINDWIKTKSETTYITVMDDYKTCTFKHKWKK